MGRENQELLQLVTAMAEDVGDFAESAEATRRASAGLSASAARLEASAADIESVADRAADAAAAKVAESADASLASFRAEYGRLAHDVLADAMSDARAEIAAARKEAASARKASRLMGVACAVFAIVALGFSYAVGRIAIDQIASANAAIESTNELVVQVNAALGTALPPADPIPGAAMAGIINDIFNALYIVIGVAVAIGVGWCFFFGRKHW